MSDKRRTPHTWTEEQKEFMFQNNKGKSLVDIQSLFNNHFCLDLTKNQIKAFRNRFKLLSGIDGCFKKGNVPLNKGKKGMWNVGGNRTSFKKGQRPQNWKPIGTERINGDGYVDVKVSDTGPPQFRWKLKSKILWEEAHGQIPDGAVFRYLDGDRLNVTLDNLVLITKQQNVVLNKNGLIFQDPELNRTGLKIADVILASGKRKRGTE